MMEEGNVPRSSEADVSIWVIGSLVLDHLTAFVAVPVCAAVLVVAVTLLIPASYTSEAIFTPQGSEIASGGQLAQLAAQFGVSIPTSTQGQSPEFYRALLTLHPLLEQTVETRFDPRNVEDGDAHPAGTLVEIYEIEGDTRPERVEKAVKSLRDRISASVDPETGVVRFSVETRWAALSEGIARRLLELVHRFDVETRQTQAAAERRFLDSRLSDARSALTATEDSLQRFLEKNRSYEQSPALRFIHNRFQRRVTLHQQIVSSLSEALEQAKIQEVRDTPVVTVVQEPTLPANPDRQWLAVKALLAALLAGMAVVLWIFGRSFFDAMRREYPDEFGQFRESWQRARKRMGALFARFGF